MATGKFGRRFAALGWLAISAAPMAGGCSTSSNNEPMMTGIGASGGSGAASNSGTGGGESAGATASSGVSAASSGAPASSGVSAASSGTTTSSGSSGSLSGAELNDAEPTGSEETEASTGGSSNDATTGSMTPGSDASIPAPVSFATNVYPIIMKNCTAHHIPPTPSGGLDMSSEMTAFNNLTLNNLSSEKGCNEDYVLFDDAVDSLLYQKVANAGIPQSCGSPMPFMLPQLSQSDIQVIQNWITTGSNQ